MRFTDRLIAALNDEDADSDCTPIAKESSRHPLECSTEENNPCPKPGSDDGTGKVEPNDLREEFLAVKSSPAEKENEASEEGISRNVNYVQQEIEVVGEQQKRKNKRSVPWKRIEKHFRRMASRKLMVKGLTEWAEWARRRVSSQQLAYKHSGVMRRRRLRMLIAQWHSLCLYTAGQVQSMAMGRVVVSGKKQRLKAAFAAWRSFHAKLKSCRHTVTKAQLSSHFQQWRMYSTTMREAIRIRRQCWRYTLSKMFDLWQQQMLTARGTEELSEKFRENAIQNHAIKGWRYRTWLTTQAKRLTSRIAQDRQSRRLRTAWNKWLRVCMMSVPIQEDSKRASLRRELEKCRLPLNLWRQHTQIRSLLRTQLWTKIHRLRDNCRTRCSFELWAEAVTYRGQGDALNETPAETRTNETVEQHVNNDTGLIKRGILKRRMLLSAWKQYAAQRRVISQGADRQLKNCLQRHLHTALFKWKRAVQQVRFRTIRQQDLLRTRNRLSTAVVFSAWKSIRVICKVDTDAVTLQCAASIEMRNKSQPFRAWRRRAEARRRLKQLWQGRGRRMVTLRALVNPHFMAWMKYKRAAKHHAKTVQGLAFQRWFGPSQDKLGKVWSRWCVRQWEKEHGERQQSAELLTSCFQLWRDRIDKQDGRSEELVVAMRVRKDIKSMLQIFRLWQSQVQVEQGGKEGTVAAVDVKKWRGAQIRHAQHRLCHTVKERVFGAWTQMHHTNRIIDNKSQFMRLRRTLRNWKEYSQLAVDQYASACAKHYQISTSNALDSWCDFLQGRKRLKQQVLKANARLVKNAMQSWNQWITGRTVMKALGTQPSGALPVTVALERWRAFRGARIRQRRRLENVFTNRFNRQQASAFFGLWKDVKRSRRMAKRRSQGRNQCIVERIFQCWSHAASRRGRQLGAATALISHHNLCLAYKAMAAWKAHHHVRRQKLSLLTVTRKMVNTCNDGSRLLRICWNTWTSSQVRKRHCENAMIRIAKRGCCSVRLKGLFKKWKTSIESKQRVKALRRKVKLKLQLRFLRQWKAYHMQRGIIQWQLCRLAKRVSKKSSDTVPDSKPATTQRAESSNDLQLKQEILALQRDKVALMEELNAMKIHLMQAQGSMNMPQEMKVDSNRTEKSDVSSKSTHSYKSESTQSTAVMDKIPDYDEHSPPSPINDSRSTISSLNSTPEASPRRRKQDLGQQHSRIASRGEIRDHCNPQPSHKIEGNKGSMKAARPFSAPMARTLGNVKPVNFPKVYAGKAKQGSSARPVSAAPTRTLSAAVDQGPARKPLRPIHAKQEEYMGKSNGQGPTVGIPALKSLKKGPSHGEYVSRSGPRLWNSSTNPIADPMDKINRKAQEFVEQSKEEMSKLQARLQRAVCTSNAIKSPDIPPPGACPQPRLWRPFEDQTSAPSQRFKGGSRRTDSCVDTHKAKGAHSEEVHGAGRQAVQLGQDRAGEFDVGAAHHEGKWAFADAGQEQIENDLMAELVRLQREQSQLMGASD